MSRVDNVIITDEVTKTDTDTKGTEYIALPEKGYLSQINLRAAMKAAWADESALHCWMGITKIEVLVNGSQIVKSYDARQLRALAWYHGMELPPLGSYGRGGTGDKTFWTYPILFGTHVGDWQHMLNLDLYENPQLKITWDATQYPFDGINRDITANPGFRYGVDALMFRGEPPEPVLGYVKSSQIDSYITANNKIKDTRVPRGQDLLGLMVGGRYDAIDTPEFFNNFKLDFDNGAWVALDHGFMQLMAFYGTWWPRTVETAMYESISNGDTPDPMVGLLDDIAYVDGSGNIGAIQISGFDYPLYDWGLLSVTDGSALTGRNDTQLHYFGRLPHQCFYIPMHAFTGEKWKPLPTGEYGTIDLEITLGSGVGANATEKILAEYVIPNGM